ncbi:MAG: glycosyltransferase family 2 protein [Spirochaetaceae bacterium]
MATVSVVIPTYNRRELLRRAVASVLEQELTDFELIVVDDASTDGTDGYLLRLAEEEPRLHPLLLEKHLGSPGAVRNRGVRASRAPLIAFLDSDDRWRPEKLRLQVPFHRSAGVRVSHTREAWIRGGKRVSQKGQRHRREGDLFADALKKCIIGPSTVLLDRTVFEEHGVFDETLEVAEDYELWLRIAAWERVAYLDQELTEKHAGHGDQLSERYGQIEGFRIEALRRVLGAGVLPRLREREARAELARKLRIFAAGARKRGREKEAFALEREAEELEHEEKL